MNKHILIAMPYEAPTVEEVKTYLENKGWSLYLKGKGFLFYRKNVRGEVYELDVPSDEKTTHYVSELQNLLTNLAILEERNIYYVYDEMKK